MEQYIEEAYEIFRQYEALVKKWQKAVNLVSDSSLSHIWERHILDSAQLYSYIPQSAKILVDMGSGAGFPGIVLAILNKVYQGTLTDIYLIESDNKKCVFLTETARVLDVGIHVINNRLENIHNIKADVITARALAPVSQLLMYSQPFLKKNTQLLLLKGSSVKSELEGIHKNYQIEFIPSHTDKTGYIVRIMKGEKHD